MKQLVVANWKANLSPAHADEWFRIFCARYQPRPDIEVVLAVPFLFLEQVAAQVKELPGISLAAQGVSPYPGGSYTGSTPASWLQGMVEYALLGHRERRKYFHETVQDIAAQVRECVSAGIKPILCLGDEGISDMQAALDGGELAAVLPAYTPDAAVALEKAREITGIQEGIARVSGYFRDRPVLYGGGVDAENSSAILALPEVSGIMLGRGCLDAEIFVQTLKGK
ncbi:MAG: triose-phosphate isomerase [Desulfobulbaceae bacterium]|nr:triose-phosphate isomerase [Desulfobulbaceae bacterium]